MARPEEVLSEAVQFKVRNKSGQVVAVIPAYRCAIPGLLVHRKADEIAWAWTVSHHSGFKIGGRFKSQEEAQQMVGEHFRRTKVDWRVAPEHLVRNIYSEIEARSFQQKFSTLATAYPREQAHHGLA